MQKLKFDGQEFDVVDHGGQPCLTMADVAIALYGKGIPQSADTLRQCVKRVHDLYTRHADEFTDTMTAIVEMLTPGGRQRVRVFSLRGAHLLGMFARTERAKAFRRWVLDVIDHHLDQSQSKYQEYLGELHKLSDRRAVASLHGRGLNQWRLDKPPMEERVRQLEIELQPSLFIH